MCVFVHFFMGRLHNTKMIIGETIFKFVPSTTVFTKTIFNLSVFMMVLTKIVVNVSTYLQKCHQRLFKDCFGRITIVPMS